MSTPTSSDEQPDQQLEPNAIRRFVQSASFQLSIVVLIVMAAILVGLETYPSITKNYGGLIHGLNRFILLAFVAEAVLKMVQHGRQFLKCNSQQHGRGSRGA